MLNNQALKCLQVSLSIGVEEPGHWRQPGSLEPISESMFMKCGSLRGTLHSVIAPFAGWAGPRGPPRPETREI